MKPRVTIIIPCFNAEPFVEQCILSAFSQTYENVEVIAIDNESTDNSLNVLQRLDSEHKNLVIGSAPNLYKYAWEEPVQEALKMSSGDYITILGADDYISPYYVENFMKYFIAKPDKVLCLQSWIRGVENQSGNILKDVGHSYKGSSEFKETLFEKCPVNTPTVVYSRKIYEDGLLTWNGKDYLGASDYELYFKLTDNNIFIYPISQWLGYYYRWHEGQATWGMHKETTNYDKLIREDWREKWTQS
jgi:glycosyltransferase involved in cell wall biosynthesis